MVELVGMNTLLEETDPHGKDQHEPGAKLDAGKIRPALVFKGFRRALIAVAEVGTAGAAKYTDNGWMEVPNGIDRYDDAKWRHWLEPYLYDHKSGSLHAAHEAWNALARLELILRELETADAQREQDLYP